MRNTRDDREREGECSVGLASEAGSFVIVRSCGRISGLSSFSAAFFAVHLHKVGKYYISVPACSSCCFSKENSRDLKLCVRVGDVSFGSMVSVSGKDGTAERVGVLDDKSLQTLH